VSRRAGALAVVAIVITLFVAVGVAFTADDRDDSRGSDGRPVVYVAVGADTDGVAGADDAATQAWPVLFHRESLPKGSTFTNVAVSGSTAAQALQEQVPKAVAAEPDLVTVWLNVNDLRALVDPATYGAQLREVLTALRRGGATTVLVANTPELDQLPVFQSLPIPPALIEDRVAAYNREIDGAATATGAVVVDLHSESEELERAGRIPAVTSSDGFHPNAAGYREVARVFGEAYRRLESDVDRRAA
jgi:acyl-CoA thioesterase I